MSDRISARSHGDPRGFLTEAECQAIFERCVALVVPRDAQVFVSIKSMWVGNVQWARNRAFLGRDVHQATVSVLVLHRGASSSGSTTQLDDAGLRDMMRRAEEGLKFGASFVDYDTRVLSVTPAPHLHPTLWSDATYAFDSERRGEAVRRIIAPIEAAGLLAAGEFRVKAGGTTVLRTNGTHRHYPSTRVEFSTTVRDAKGTGSGWAGTDDFEIGRIDVAALAQRAHDKCRASMNPVALEPGRYTTILEPQAVADLWAPLAMDSNAMLRFKNEVDWDAFPFGKAPFLSKITERVLDPRLSMISDPMDPIGGFIPFDFLGTPYQRTRWIDDGILRQLEYNKTYGLMLLGTDEALAKPRSWRLAGSGTASVDEMISTTKRGLLVTRFHEVQPFHMKSWSCTGYTRDGLWLIENGKISKPVKNFRFTESPLFMFNNVEQIGESMRVFSGNGSYAGEENAWVAPALKVRDFNFSQLADAV